MANILVVDDELGIRDLLSEILNDEGHAVEVAENAAAARKARAECAYDLVLLDIWMPDTDGVSLLKEWAMAGLLTMPVIMMSGHATIDTAVEATRIGAFSFLEKPITLQKLLKAVNQALEKPADHASSNTASAAAHVKKSAAPASSSEPFRAHTSTGAGGVLQATQEPVANLIRAIAPENLVPDAQQLFDLDKPLREARDEFEKAYFEFHLAQESGSMTRVAEKTGLERTHLYRKLRQLGVELGKRRNA